jgi:hypothetical protein
MGVGWAFGRRPDKEGTCRLESRLAAAIERRASAGRSAVEQDEPAARSARSHRARRVKPRLVLLDKRVG